MSASESGGWSQNYVYDAFGNRAVTQASTQLDTPRTPVQNSDGTLLFNANNQWTLAIADAVSMIDPTGIGSATRSALTGDTKGALIAMAVMGVPGGSGGKIALSEAKRLVGGWSVGTFEKIGASIAYHFEKHGAEVGAGSVWQYLRKAEGFARNLKGATKTALGDGATRYTKNGKYVILDQNRKIISYGIE